MRIGLVNDLALALEALRRVLAKAPQHQIAWMARDGAEAVNLCAQDRPDLILMDLIMPVMDGVEATRRIMAATPCAILVVTATVEGTTSRVFDALGAGALDAVNTPALTGDGAAVLLAKLDALGRLIGDTASPQPTATDTVVEAKPASGHRPWLVAIGASAGGPAAVAELLKEFRPNTRAAFVVIQHLDESFAPGLADWLRGQIELPVRLAREGDVPEPGVVLLPGRDDHLVFNPRGALIYRKEPVEYVYRPSVDEFFGSVVAHWRGRSAGVILTGMGRDGAQGLKAMHDTRHPTFAQDQASCAAYGMPRAAVELGGADWVLPLREINRQLRQLLST